MNIECNAPNVPIPVLVPCKAGEREGYATFTAFNARKPVRSLRDADFQNEEVWRALPDHAREHWYATLHLVQAYGEGEKREILRAKQGLAKARKMRPRLKRRTQTDLEYSRLLGIDLDMIEGFKPPRHAEEDIRHLLSYEASRALHDRVQLVLWWSGKRFLLALYCEDIQAALYVGLLLRFFGADTAIRICPQCGNPYVQVGRADQAFCSTAHRDAYRMARWRARTKKKQGRRPLAPVTA